MSKLRSRLGKKHKQAKQVACTISAAALMLGVSEAATVGLHFQENYCGSAAYSGFPVTLTAFGIAPAGWENLTAMQTGYSAACDAQQNYTLNQTISTTTSSDGLNPLPNGTLDVTWSANGANFSGFAGYGGKPPSYGYSGQPPSSIPTGEWQIYNTFLRDGVNFGVGSSCADNTQPAYVVDITGLKSVFTNSSYVVELIAASDSMITLTNALVIDATALTTNVVSYPSTPLPFDQGGTCGQWLRGHGGGISTVSTNFNTDHIQITSMHPAHGGTGAPPDGYDQAGTISGFIITDKPVVTMSAQPVLAGPGDKVTLNPYAIGVSPLSYQWLLNGAAVPNGTNSSLVISNLTAALAGNYVLTVTNIYGSATSAVTVVTEDSLSLSSGTNYVADTNPVNTPRIGLNAGATWEATNTDGILGRAGVMDFVATNADEITVAGTSNFDSPTGTIALWMRSNGTDPAATATMGAALFGISTANNGNDLILAQQPGGNIYFNAPFSSSGGTLLTSFGTISDDKWHLIAVTFDQSDTGSISIYIDGVLDNTVGNAQAWTWPLGTAIQIGNSTDTNNWSPYDGQLDDVRFYNRELTAGELASIYSSNALVDTNALEMQLNFDAAPGSGYSLAWQMAGAVLQSSPNLLGPYTDVPAATSPFSFIPQTGANNFYRYRFTHQVLVSNPYLM